jgi:DNA-binding response OmpR family regulator
MPGMSGLELIRRGRRISPELRAMLITAFGSPEIEGLSHEVGAVYLPKPFGAWEFISAVQNTLEEGCQSG